MKCFWNIVLGVLLAFPITVQAEELCMEGTLLFREDFGGNDPNDPEVITDANAARAAVPGMSSDYTPCLSRTSGMSSGKFLVTKQGYMNGSGSSQWHLQDDHTHFGDLTRGYLLEIDGQGDNAPFYATTIDGLCPGSRLTFSAYVANVMTWGMYVGRPGVYAYPRLKFVLTNPSDNTELATYDTGDILYDDSFVGDNMCWQQSAQWQLVGMNFTVPAGVWSIRLSIYNNVNSYNGNDFALDDIEIRLCAPPVTIEGEAEVCANEAATLTAQFTNDGTFPEPLGYKWFFSADSISWETLDETSDVLNIPTVHKTDSGWYQIAVAGDEELEYLRCRAMSEPFMLKVNDCTPVEPVTVTIVSPDSVCPNDPYTFEVEIENEDQLETPIEYQWWYRSPEQPNVWKKVSGGTHRNLQIASFKTQHVGWYKLMVAGRGQMDIEEYRWESEEYYVTFKKCEPELCLDGMLLYRDDFGGNDPNDPRVGTDPVPGMAYTQLTSDRFGGMGSGRYLVTKEGYCNGDTVALRQRYGYVPNWGSQWILQDDHTYQNDRTRGYFVEIDGAGGNTPFYSTTIDGLCSGSKLTFSAYVVNVHFFQQIQKFFRENYGYVYPRMKFVLKNPETGEVLAEQSTGDIQPDVTKLHNIHLRESADWQLVGMEFIVPEDVESIQMYIYNDVSSTGTGNDFAIDDIEIHLCAPPATIEGEAEICENEEMTLTANFTNDGTFPEPLGYKWFFSADSISWETLDETSDVLNIPTVHKTDSGWYQIAVAGDGNIESVNCRAMSEPFMLKVKECVDELCVDGTLLFREDFGGNSPDDPDVSNASVPGMDPSYHNSGNSLGSGNYTLRKEGWHNGIQWHWQDDHTYFGDKTRGYLLEVDGIGGAKPFYSKTIDGLCAGSKLTFSAYVVNVHYAGQLDYFGSSYVYPRMKFVLKNPETGAVLAEKSTGDIQPDWRYGTSETWKYARDNQLSAEWQLIGMNFTVPEGVESIQMYIYNDVLQNGNGNDFALDDIEIHLCAPPVTIEGEAEVCANEAATLTAQFTNDGTFPEPLGYKWFFSADSISWETLDETSDVLNIPTVHKTDSGWYQIAVAGDGNIESVNCRAMSEPFLLTVKECEPPVPPCPEMVTITADTLVCDTLMPYRWRDTLFTETARYEILYKDKQGCDSLLAIYTLSVQKCCPTIATLRYDTVVCDTLMPFTWVIDGYTYVFEEPETQAREVMHPKWTDCQEKQYYVRVQTIHCEKLWPLIVNKYNWQLLLDNVAMARFFPGRAIRALQWYKDGQAIIGATGDDYSEQNELHGVFQLQIELDGQQIVWSNILTIGDEQEEPQPVQVRIYNSRGMLMREDQMTHGVYLYHYQQGDYIWTEKRVVL